MGSTSSTPVDDADAVERRPNTNSESSKETTTATFRATQGANVNNLAQMGHSTKQMGRPKNKIHQIVTSSRVQCGCCLEDRTFNQGIQCPNGHFYCIVEPCLEMAVKAQIMDGKKKDEASHDDGFSIQVHCPLCQASYSCQDIAAKLPAQMTKQIMQNSIDREVAKRCNKMKEEYETKIEILIDLAKQPGAGLVNFIARRQAQKTRESILSLSCPHCNTVYADFDGCMVLQCGHCRGLFCGYCHEKTPTVSRDAHAHVRRCPMNRNNRNSTFATKQQIDEAQLRYREKALKAFLAPFDDVQRNAIVKEIAEDLMDLGIVAWDFYISDTNDALSYFKLYAIKPNTIVSLRNMAHQPDLNGARAKVLRYDPLTNRCKVKLLRGEQQTLFVKQSDLMQHIMVEHEGERVRITGWKDSREKYIVRMPGLNVLVDPRSIIVPPGTVVQIVGLTTDMYTNGVFGVVEAWDATSKTYCIRPSPYETVHVGVGNIRV